jgi:hypothetical protein
MSYETLVFITSLAKIISGFKIWSKIVTFKNNSNFEFSTLITRKKTLNSTQEQRPDLDGGGSLAAAGGGLLGFPVRLETRMRPGESDSIRVEFGSRRQTG